VAGGAPAAAAQKLREGGPEVFKHALELRGMGGAVRRGSGEAAWAEAAQSNGQESIQSAKPGAATAIGNRWQPQT
jgi:hypothetical protein